MKMPMTAYAMTIQTVGQDQYILVAAVSAGDFAVARFTMSGAVDASFGPDSNGVAKANFGGTDTARAVGVQSSGRIILAGLTSLGYSLAAFDEDGDWTRPLEPMGS